MTRDPESEWREWYRREYGCEPAVHPFHVKSLLEFTAQRRDELTAAERDVVDAALAKQDAHKRENNPPANWWYPESHALWDACNRLRAARTPAPVDHLQAALDLLRESNPSYMPIPTIMKHIEAAIARSKEAR